MHAICGGGDVLVIGNGVARVHYQCSTARTVSEHGIEGSRLRVAGLRNFPDRRANGVDARGIGDIESATRCAVVDKAIGIELQLEECLPIAAVRVSDCPADPEGGSDRIDGASIVGWQHYLPCQILSRTRVI